MEQNHNQNQNSEQTNSQLIPKFEVSVINENDINSRELDNNETIISPFIVSLPPEEGLKPFIFSFEGRIDSIDNRILVFFVFFYFRRD